MDGKKITYSIVKFQIHKCVMSPRQFISSFIHLTIFLLSVMLEWIKIEFIDVSVVF